MEVIPSEIVQYIFRFVDDCTPFSFVCRLWRDLLPEKTELRGIKNYLSYLAKRGHLETLKWARENGAP